MMLTEAMAPTSRHSKVARIASAHHFPRRYRPTCTRQQRRTRLRLQTHSWAGADGIEVGVGTGRQNVHRCSQPEGCRVLVDYTSEPTIAKNTLNLGGTMPTEINIDSGKIGPGERYPQAHRWTRYVVCLARQTNRKGCAWDRFCVQWEGRHAQQTCILISDNIVDLNNETRIKIRTHTLFTSFLYG